ncbi:MAG: sugar ABC transporter substrate-binding protein [Oscillospiraceae bacterium]|nr:sugar ABC transporter substrate-binding protein [Oscillospiraceae bacterium]
MKKRSFAIIMTAIMLLSIFAACGGGAGAPPASSDSEAAPSGSGEAAPAPGGDDSAVDLVFWHMEEPPHRVRRFNEVFDQFNEEHPDINFSGVVQSWNDAYTLFPAAIMAGTGPDLMLTSPDHATIIYELGKNQPVTDIINAIDSQQSLLPASIESYKFGDEYYAVPVYGMAQVLWYRKDMFDAAGLSPPKTWDELIAAAEALTSGDVYGIALPASRTMATDQVIWSFMTAGGARNMIDSNNTVDFNNPQTVAAYELYETLMKFSPPDSTTFAWGEPQALFNSGKAAMAIEKGQYLLPWTDESGRPPEDLDCVLIPTPTGSNYGSYFLSNGVMLLSEGEDKKAAASTFFQWLLQPETYGYFINAEPGLFLPVTETGAKAQSFLNDPIISQYPKQVETLLEASNIGMLYGFTDGAAMRIGQITGPNLKAATLEQIVVGGMSPSDAVAWGQAEMERAVAG